MPSLGEPPPVHQPGHSLEPVLLGFLEASLYRHDQTFNSIFRFSPFSKEVCVVGEGGGGLLKISSFKSLLGLSGDQFSSKNHSGVHPELPC